MKLCRYGPNGAEKPGVIDAQGRLRDLSALLQDITAGDLSPDRLLEVAAIDPDSLPLVDGPQRYGVPFTGTRQFIAIGLNYADHAAEAGMEIPGEPIFFTKGVSCIQGPNDPVTIPRGSTKTDWEVELGVVIGRRAEYVEVADALDYVAGYVVVDDVSERSYQLERGPTWDKGKGCATFGPIGPWLVTKDEVGDVQNLKMWLEVNGKRVQNGSTSTMIFDVSTIVSYVSEFMTLLPGDIITTGTPPGVGMGMKPQPRFLSAGDVVTLGIEGLGEQRQTFVAYESKA